MRSALGAFNSSPDVVKAVLNAHSFSPTPTEVVVPDQSLQTLALAVERGLTLYIPLM